MDSSTTIALRSLHFDGVPAIHRRRLQLAVGLGITIYVLTGAAATATIIPLSSPSGFIFPTTTIDFDGVPGNTVTNTLYSGLGIEFSRDDAQPVPTLDWAALSRITTSDPNVIATHIGGGATSFVLHLNLDFDSPTYELGSFFGNDQGGVYTQTTLSVYDALDTFLGSVIVSTNDNTSVDQFIGLRSTIPFFSARFENDGLSLSVVLDDVSFTVPEPTTLALLGLGLSILGISRRRKVRLP